MRSRFARLRGRPAHRDEQRPEPRPDEWLLIEWPRGAAAPTKYWLSTLPATITMADLVRLAKLCWRIERDYQELTDELGPRAAAGGLPSSRRVMYRGVFLHPAGDEATPSATGGDTQTHHRRVLHRGGTRPDCSPSEPPKSIPEAKGTCDFYASSASAPARSRPTCARA